MEEGSRTFPALTDRPRRRVNLLCLIFTAVLVLGQFLVPRRVGFAVLLIAVCHLPNLQAISLGGAGFTAVRLVILAGLMRAGAEGFLAWSSRNSLDVLMGLWSAVALLSTLGHHPRYTNPLSERLALIYDLMGTYLFARAYLRTPGDFLRFTRVFSWVLISMAIPLLAQKLMRLNLYAGLGDVQALVREGTVRASGAFGHPILAGTAGGVALPLMVALHTWNRRLGMAGIMACAAIVV